MTERLSLYFIDFSRQYNRNATSGGNDGALIFDVVSSQPVFEKRRQLAASPCSFIAMFLHVFYLTIQLGRMGQPRSLGCASPDASPLG